MDGYFEMITPQAFGAVADGEHDDTEAIRKAIERASEKEGYVYFPCGVYRTDTVFIPQNLCLEAKPTWSYRTNGRAVITPLKEDQECVFEISNAIGTTIKGLCFDGKNLGENMHGISMCRERHTVNPEHTLRFETCKVCNFSGNGMNMVGAWAVSIRTSMFCGNAGYGFYLDGCDAFIVDNFFSFNNIGFGGDTWNSAVNFTSNRVEWNKICGIKLSGGMRYNLTGNYIDRSYGPAIVIEAAENYHKRLHKTHTVVPYAITVTGNTIVRSGKDAEPGSDDDCHILLRNAAGITVTGNTFNVWKDDGRNGRISPWYGFVIENCSHCVIADNAMLPGAVKELIHDKGGHGEQMIIENNAGAPVPESARDIQDPFTPVHYMSEGNAPWYAEKLAGESNE